MAVAIAHVFAIPAQCQAHRGECHDNVYYLKQTLSLQKVASVAIACSWTRIPSRDQCVDPAFHRPNAMLASRCDWVVSCDLIFTPKFFGLPATLLAPHFALPMDHRTTNIFGNTRYGFFVVAEKHSHCRSISGAPECAW